MEFNLASRETIFSSLMPNGIGAEIGVDAGDFSESILQNAKPKLLYLIDCWETQSVEAYGHDPANKIQRLKDHAYNQVFRRFLAFDSVRVIKGYSEFVSTLFPDGFFDWLYIDANHLQCYADLKVWWPKVKLGGYMMGHDYVKGGVGDFITVADDVDKFVAEMNLQMLLTDDVSYKNYIIQKV